MGKNTKIQRRLQEYEKEMHTQQTCTGEKECPVCEEPTLPSRFFLFFAGFFIKFAKYNMTFRYTNEIPQHKLDELNNRTKTEFTLKKQQDNDKYI